MNLIDYPIIIKHPMDLSTIKKKLKSSKYKIINDFIDDIQLIWDNCKLYNQEGSVNLLNNSSYLIRDYVIL